MAEVAGNAADTGVVNDIAAENPAEAGKAAGRLNVASIEPDIDAVTGNAAVIHFEASSAADIELVALNAGDIDVDTVNVATTDADAVNICATPGYGRSVHIVASSMA
jgi:hypothetical protein